MADKPFEVKADSSGKFFAKKIVKSDDWVCKLKAIFVGELLKPAGCTIKAKLYVTIKRDGKEITTSKDFTAQTGKPVKIGPFEVDKCDMLVELEGISDKPNEMHSFQAEGKLA